MIIMDRRNEDERKDPRNRDSVSVRSYRKKDGTEVEEHTRGLPVIKAKLKMEITDAEARVKGKIRRYKDGRKVSTERVDETYGPDGTPK